jgi:ABC-type sugar transport system ATPase subunit
LKDWNKIYYPRDTEPKDLKLSTPGLKFEEIYDPKPITFEKMAKLLHKYTRKCTVSFIDDYKKMKIVHQWIQDLDIKVSNTENPISTLSGGNQQKIVLAKWILTQPKVLILDAPTVGVDIAAKSSIYQLIHKLAEQGISILLISDEIPEVYYNCD